MRKLVWLWIVMILAGIQNITAQQVSPDDWELVKQKEGIRIYTAHQKESPILAYRIETTIKGDLRKVYQQVVDFEGNKKFLDTVEKIRVLQRKPGENVLVYMLFDLPWPFSDRDFINRMDMELGRDTIVLRSSPATDVVDPKDGVVRIRKFSERWLLVKQPGGKTKLSLQGYADPGGALPAWIINRFVVREPHALVEGIKDQVEKDPGA
jgi:hypothetical protein